MFFDDLKDISKIAKHTSCTVFVVPPEIELNLPFALYLRPDQSKASKSITVEQIRDFTALTNNHETTDRYFVITPADAMNVAAMNAFLKTFEEPGEFCHFILLTEHPATLLPTILSRAQVFYYRKQNCLTKPPQVNPKTLALAKQLITASDRDLVALATDLAKVKTNARENALNVTATAIELLYKSYFKTKNPKFLTKLPNFIKLYESLKNNGHIKLHIVADLI